MIAGASQKTIRMGLAAFCAMTFIGQAWAAAEKAPPDFAPSSHVGWVVVKPLFMAPVSGPGPVMEDPAHPHISGVVSTATGKQATFYIANSNNPILQPWAKAAVEKRNADIFAGKNGETRPVSCWPMGVPGFLLYPVEPMFFIQTPKEVLIVAQQDFNVRRVYLNVPHSAHIRPTWYGESVGHYEGDTMVVDTVGMNDQTYIDHFRTPHTAQLHVVERFHMTDGGKMLQVDVHVDDPGAFTTPWNAIQRYNRIEQDQINETYCAENDLNYNKFMNFGLEAMPENDRPGF